MNEGIASTKLGLKGIPALAEEVMLARDIELLEYTKVNFTLVEFLLKKVWNLSEQLRKKV